MIVVEYVPGELILTGHAGFAPIGQDIVCASASILMYNLIDLLYGEGCEVPEGGFRVRYDPKDKHKQQLVDYTVNGLRILSRNYGKNITFKSGLP